MAVVVVAVMMQTEEVVDLAVAGIAEGMEGAPPREPARATPAELLQHMEIAVRTQDLYQDVQAQALAAAVRLPLDQDLMVVRVFLSLLLALPKFMVLEVAVMQAQGVAEEQTQETGPVEQVLQAMGAASMLLTILVVEAAGPPVETALPAQGARVS